MTPSTTQVKGGGTVRFTTSIEATVTCTTAKNIELKQIDALTWEATIPPEDCLYRFTAIAGDEEVFCYVRNEVQ